MCPAEQAANMTDMTERTIEKNHWEEKSDQNIPSINDVAYIMALVQSLPLVRGSGACSEDRDSLE